jgi:LPS sulfotransferase NodH
MSLIYKLYGPECDFAPFQQAPSIEYMLATIPRSGSTFFATELWRTGILGSPMEYLNPLYVRVIGSRKDFDPRLSILNYWEWVKRHRTSPNGVFGYKMFPTNYVRVSDREPEWLTRITPNKVIFLSRRNILAHAVSYSKAIRSNSWFYDVKPQVIEYNYEHVRMCVEMIRSQLSFWSELFDLAGAEVCKILYEDVVTDLDSTVRSVADFLGVRYRPPKRIGPALFHVQRNSQSDEWMKRYVEDDERCAPSATAMAE